jgi:adenylate cyclase
MAFWGAPLAQPDHAERAVRCAALMLDHIERRRAECIEAGQTPFDLGVGVHTGLAVVGNIGHESRLDYTVIGDTVNVAARIESATREVGEQALVSSATVQAMPLEARQLLPFLGTVQLRGRAQPVRVHSITRAASALELDLTDDIAA